VDRQRAVGDEREDDRIGEDQPAQHRAAEDEGGDRGPGRRGGQDAEAGEVPALPREAESGGADERDAGDEGCGVEGIPLIHVDPRRGPGMRDVGSSRP
jgi:hypothetical protein